MPAISLFMSVIAKQTTERDNTLCDKERSWTRNELQMRKREGGGVRRVESAGGTRNVGGKKLVKLLIIKVCIWFARERHQSSEVRIFITHSFSLTQRVCYTISIMATEMHVLLINVSHWTDYKHSFATVIGMQTNFKMFLHFQNGPWEIKLDYTQGERLLPYHWIL